MARDQYGQAIVSTGSVEIQLGKTKVITTVQKVGDSASIVGDSKVGFHSIRNRKLTMLRS